MEAKGIDVVTPYGLETALHDHLAVAEPGLIGRADELRGDVISVFVALKHGLIPLNKFLAKEKYSDRRAEETHSAHSVDMV